MPMLFEKLKGIKLSEGKIKTNDWSPLPKMKFDRLTLDELCDINLLTEDNMVLKCHRCVLIARSEYFHSMLSSGWIGTSFSKPLALPIRSKVLELVLDYLYTDSSPNIFASDDPEFLCNVLVVADQLLLDRFKAICEQALVEMITLRNVTELLELSYIYNAAQLKTTCMQYICLNLASIIENESLNLLSDEVMEGLTSYYRNLLPGMSKRLVTPYTGGPTHEEMLFFAEQFPANGKIDLVHPSTDNTITKSSEGKVKGRNRNHSCRLSSDEYSLPKEKYNSEKVNVDVPVFDCDIKDTAQLDMLKVYEEKELPVVKKETPTLYNDTSQKHLLKTGWCLENKNNIPQLKDIMKEEEVTQNSRKPGHSQQHNQAGWTWNMKPITKDIKPLKIASKINSPLASSCWNMKPITEDIKPLNIASKINSPPSSSCWNMKCTVGEPPVPNFSDILKTEQHVQNLTQLTKAKPLHLIHLEDEAIEELLKLYNAKDNYDEHVTVTRLLPERIGAPVWKKNSFSAPKTTTFK